MQGRAELRQRRLLDQPVLGDRFDHHRAVGQLADVRDHADTGRIRSTSG